jgi:hypothetical protein
MACKHAFGWKPDQRPGATTPPRRVKIATTLVRNDSSDPATTLCPSPKSSSDPTLSLPAASSGASKSPAVSDPSLATASTVPGSLRSLCTASSEAMDCGLDVPDRMTGSPFAAASGSVSSF